jgi:broad specificity phosphatase PhoE
MEVFLVRHGAVEHDAARLRGDPPLSELGRGQARALAERLRDTHFDRCLVSPLVRAQETAQLLTFGRAIPLETHACLAEGSYGALDGMERGSELARYPEHFRLGRTVIPRLAATGETAPGGESRSGFLARAQASHALVAAALADPTARVLVVSHGGLLAYLIQLLLGHEPRDQVTIGFDFCGVARVLSYREEPAFGPFAMLHFAAH